MRGFAGGLVALRFPKSMDCVDCDGSIFVRSVWTNSDERLHSIEVSTVRTDEFGECIAEFGFILLKIIPLNDDGDSLLDHRDGPFANSCNLRRRAKRHDPLELVALHVQSVRQSEISPCVVIIRK